MNTNLIGVDWNYQLPDIVVDELTMRRLEIDEEIESLRRERREVQAELDRDNYLKEKEQRND